MRTVSSNLKSDLVNGYRSTIVLITTADGTEYGYTDHEFPLVVDGSTYVPAPGLSRTNLTATTDAQVSNQEFGSAWVDAPEEDLISGKFDNATVEVAFCSWQNPAYGRLVVDKGNLGVIQWTADGFRADMQSHMRQLTRNINFVFTASCRHALFSQFDNTSIGACTLNSASYTWSGSVNTVTTQRVSFTTNGLSQPDGKCTSGILTWTTGNNAGLSYEVKSHVVTGSTTITLFLPTMAAIAAGDTFSITAGCDKTLATCKAKFNNVVNFGGFPHIQTEVTTR